jgi:hypothetical protein
MEPILTERYARPSPLVMWLRAVRQLCNCHADGQVEHHPPTGHVLMNAIGVLFLPLL